MKKEIQSDIDFIQAKGSNLWWYDGERIELRSPNAHKILTTIMLQPDISVSELAKQVGINKSAMQKSINNLLKKGYIQRNENDGQWHVTAISAN